MRGEDRLQPEQRSIHTGETERGTGARERLRRMASKAARTAGQGDAGKSRAESFRDECDGVKVLDDAVMQRRARI